METVLDVSPSWVDKVECERREVHILMQEGALARLKEFKPKAVRP